MQHAEQDEPEHGGGNGRVDGEGQRAGRRQAERRYLHGVPQGLALLLTLAVEVPLYVAALVSLRLVPVRRALLVAVAANLVTHPALWWALGDHPSLGVLVLAEVVVWLAEALLLWLAVRRAVRVLLVVAAGANAASILAGALIAVLRGAA
ncbi:hypothetical protein GCM10009557_35300 [Virgisporangium ochraceum]